MKLLISDDHSMIRKGIRLLLTPSFQSADIFEATSCEETCNFLSCRPEISHMILDIQFPDGHSIDILPSLISTYPSLNILIYSMFPATLYAPALKRLGIKQYLSKECPEEEVFLTISSFLNNDFPRISSNTTRHPFTLLAPKELTLLHYILKGVSPSEAAEILGIKRNTVSTLKTRILEKTGAKNRKELFDLAKVYLL